MKFSDRLKEAMEIREISQADLVRRSGINKGTISNYLHDKYEPKQTAIYIIAKALNVNEAWLIGFDVPMNRTTKDETITYQIPLYSSVSCGTGLFVDDQVEDYIAVPDRYVKANVEYFANTAKGDSMIGKQINEGDVLVFERTQHLENGSIGCFCIDDNEAVCKIYRRLSSGIILLESANPNYEPIEIDVNNTCFRILGKLKFKLSVIE